MRKLVLILSVHIVTVGVLKYSRSSLQEHKTDQIFARVSQVLHGTFKHKMTPVHSNVSLVT